MKLMGTREVAAILGIRERTLRLWLSRGEISGIRTPAGWRFEERDIQAFLNKHRNVQQQEATG